ncbi:MAG TPA: histidine ammonia-lyase [Bacillota bacterium]|jgi:histidine ammonia-lyase
MDRAVLIDGHSLNLAQVERVASGRAEVALAPGARESLETARAVVDGILRSGSVVYGVTTGFGRFCDVVIPPEDVARLQRNLIVSHAAGVGEPFSEPVVRAMLLLRSNALTRGHSGVRPAVVETLLGMLNRGVIPVVPQKGSLGASGDLAPLAHLALVPLGMGEATFGGRRLPGAEAMAAAGLDPLVLEAKEGLALINGTQAMTAVGALTLRRGTRLAVLADAIGALSLEALRGIPAAFDPRLQAVRGHPGQEASAETLRRVLEGSRLTTRPGELRVQDAYALRCMPQVHGASRDALGYATEVVTREANAATDNPLIFVDDGAVISGGNFHGQPVALAMDFAGIALAELGSIAERRLERMVNPHLSGLPAFLTRKGGLNSGFMLAQYTAAALVSEDKLLASPASVDSIPSSANQEDHVSMGTIAARKAAAILDNLETILAIELLCAAQAVDLAVEQTAGAVGRSAEDSLGRGTKALYRLVRERLAPLDEDRVLASDFEVVRAMVGRGEAYQALTDAGIAAVDEA